MQDTWAEAHHLKEQESTACLCATHPRRLAIPVSVPCRSHIHEHGSKLQLRACPYCLLSCMQVQARLDLLHKNALVTDLDTLEARAVWKMGTATTAVSPR
jgi:hypothetical protein